MPFIVKRDHQVLALTIELDDLPRTYFKVSRQIHDGKKEASMY